MAACDAHRPIAAPLCTWHRTCSSSNDFSSVELGCLIIIALVIMQTKRQKQFSKHHSRHVHSPKRYLWIAVLLIRMIPVRMPSRSPVANLRGIQLASHAWKLHIFELIGDIACSNAKLCIPVLLCARLQE